MNDIKILQLKIEDILKDDCLLEYITILGFDSPSKIEELRGKISDEKLKLLKLCLEKVTEEIREFYKIKEVNGILSWKLPGTGGSGSSHWHGYSGGFGGCGGCGGCGG